MCSAWLRGKLFVFPAEYIIHVIVCQKRMRIGDPPEADFRAAPTPGAGFRFAQQAN